MPAIRNMFAFLKQLMESGNFDYFLDANQNGLGIMKTAKFTYDFAVDGGAIGTITPANSPILPEGAIILTGIIEVITVPTAGGAATIGLGLGSGAQVASLFAPITIAGLPWSPAGIRALIPQGGGSAVKVAADTKLTLTIAAFALTAGKIDVSVQYFMGNL